MTQDDVSAATKGRGNTTTKWLNPVCESNSCPGYFINCESLAVERCDTCKIFRSDDDAAAAVDALASLGLETLASCPRRELEIAARLAPLYVAMTCNAASACAEDNKDQGSSREMS